MNVFKTIAAILLVLFFIGCDSKEDLSPAEVHWDRDGCERCKMIISDRGFAAQIINKQDTKAYKFDDIGCLIMWIVEEKVTWKKDAKIYVIDADSKKWIDARTAFYSHPNVTPMSYGFAAYSDKNKIPKGKEVAGFSEVEARVVKGEE